MELNGRYNCDNDSSDGVAYLSTLEEGLIGFGFMPKDPGGCECPNCGSTFLLNSPPQVMGWSNYHYRSVNRLQFFTTTNHLCMSTIKVTLKTQNITQVNAILPPLGPAQTQFNVIIRGVNFKNQTDVMNYCSFNLNQNSFKENAQYINSTHLLCITPSTLGAGNYNFTVHMEIGQQIIPISSNMSFLLYGNNYFFVHTIHLKREYKNFISAYKFHILPRISF